MDNYSKTHRQQTLSNIINKHGQQSATHMVEHRKKTWLWCGRAWCSRVPVAQCTAKVPARLGVAVAVAVVIRIVV
jgi:hypothetical protein